MWETLKDTVGKVAPVAAGLLGGPAAGAAVKMIADAIGSDEDPEEIVKALKTDPTAALKLKELESDLEKTRITARGKVIEAEAKGESWLQRNWRPLTMLSFVGLIGSHWYGFTAENLTETQILSMFELVKIGLGGYVIGRSAEKITKTVSGTGIAEKVMKKIKEH